MFQIEVETSVNKLFEVFENIPPQLIRAKHSSFLKSSLTHLGGSYQCLDAGRPWLCYWILHSLDLLGNELESQDISKIAQFLRRYKYFLAFNYFLKYLRYNSIVYF